MLSQVALFCSEYCNDFPCHSEQKPNSTSHKVLHSLPFPTYPISDLISCLPPLLTGCSHPGYIKDAPISGPFHSIFPWSKNSSPRYPHGSLSLCLYSCVHLIGETFPHPSVYYRNFLIPGTPFSPTNRCVALNQGP